MASKKAPKGKADAQARLFREAEAVPQAKLDAIEAASKQLANMIADLPLEAKVEALNRARMALHEVSPFAFEPVDCVQWVHESCVDANKWNPNTVDAVGFRSLIRSVEKFGYTMPVVGSWVGHERPRAEINDGFHRSLVNQRSSKVHDRVCGYMPISFLPGTMTDADRKEATMLHNEARGKHSVVKEVAIVEAMAKAGWTAEEIGLATVKTEEELVRIGQLSKGGAAANLAGHRYAKAWTF